MGVFFNGEFFKLKDSLKYVNDYKTELYEDEKGKTREKITYVGPMIKFMDSQKSVRLKFAAVSLLSVLSLATAGAAVSMSHTTAWWPFVSMPTAIGLIPLLYLFLGVCSLQFNCQPMKRDRYMHSIIRIYRSAPAVFLFMLAALIAEFIYRAVYDDWIFLKNDISFLIMLILTCVFMVLIIVVLRNVNIDERELNS